MAGPGGSRELSMGLLLVVLVAAGVVLGVLLVTVGPLALAVAAAGWLLYWAVRRRPRHVPFEQASDERQSHPKYG